MYLTHVEQILATCEKGLEEKLAGMVCLESGKSTGVLEKVRKIDTKKCMSCVYHQLNVDWELYQANYHSLTFVINTIAVLKYTNP